MSHKNQLLTPDSLLGIGAELAHKIRNPAIRMLAETFAVPLVVNALTEKFGLQNNQPQQPHTIDIECVIIDEPKKKNIERSTAIKRL